MTKTKIIKRKKVVTTKNEFFLALDVTNPKIELWDDLKKQVNKARIYQKRKNVAKLEDIVVATMQYQFGTKAKEEYIFTRPDGSRVYVRKIGLADFL